MPGEKIRAIIFDIGRVLVRVDVARATAGLAAGISLSPSEIWAAIEKDARWPDWQEGRMAPHDWHLHLTKRIGSTLSFEQFTEAWNRALDPNPIQDRSLLERLSKSHRLGLLSNTDPMHVAHMERNYDFFRFFPARTYSCVVGASKPNPFIYREALRASRAQAKEAVFIDDVEAYVEVARHLGMAGIHYVSPPQLANDLEKLGVKVA
jgi:glucose-1-phosphatase